MSLLSQWTQNLKGQRQAKQPEPEEPASSRHRLASPERIAPLLQRLADEHCILTIRLKGNEATFVSSILKVDPAAHTFLMDELNPAAGHIALQEQRNFQVEARLHGVRVQFSGRVQETADQDGMAFYKVPLPDSVHYFQQREYFRANTASRRPIEVLLAPPVGDPVSGTLHDISVGGAGVVVPGDDSGEFDRGMELPSCRFSLPSADPVICSLEIRFLGALPQTGDIKLGGRFVSLQRAHQRIIERYIRGIERERQKRR